MAKKDTKETLALALFFLASRFVRRLAVHLTSVILQMSSIYIYLYVRSAKLAYLDFDVPPLRSLWPHE